AALSAGCPGARCSGWRPASGRHTISLSGWSSAAGEGASGTTVVKVPDIGDFKDVPIIEVFVKPGDTVKAEDPLITLESDKATMDAPAPSAGGGEELKVQGGDKVSEGSPGLTLGTHSAGPA